jgi:Mn2+/Fe2+ NRAMP family transporter
VSGAAAYEAGNLTGAALGLESVTGIPLHSWIGLGVALAGLLLWFGQYRLLERVLAACVAVMGLVFVVTAVTVAPKLSTLMTGILVPRVPTGADLTAIALVGTTIVPYNLFLHAAAVRERWSDVRDLAVARVDLVAAIGLGGLVSGAVVVTASAALGGGEVHSVADMARQLTPLLGSWAGKAFALGYSAAGISSAITAPLAAAYTILDAMGRGRDMRSATARVVWLGCIVVGSVTAFTSIHPVPLIILAQVVNGFMLPVVALALLVAMNDRERLGSHVNGWRGNLTGGVVALLCLVLGARAVLLAL